MIPNPRSARCVAKTQYMQIKRCSLPLGDKQEYCRESDCSHDMIGRPIQPSQPAFHREVVDDDGAQEVRLGHRRSRSAPRSGAGAGSRDREVRRVGDQPIPRRGAAWRPAGAQRKPSLRPAIGRRRQVPDAKPVGRAGGVARMRGDKDALSAPVPSHAQALLAMSRLCHPSSMRKLSPLRPQRPTRARPAGFVIGRDRFARISAVEGVALTPDMRADLERFDRDGLSAAERRSAIHARFASAH